MGLGISREQRARGGEHLLRVAEDAVLVGVEATDQVDGVLPRDVAETARDRPVRPVGQRRQLVADEVAGGGAFRKDRQPGAQSLRERGEVPDLVEVGLGLADHAIHLRDGDGEIEAGHGSLLSAR